MTNSIVSTEGGLTALSSCTWVNLLPARFFGCVFVVVVFAVVSASASGFDFAAVL